MQPLPTTRSCGPCRGCCKPFAVREVGKHDASWCPKSTPRNGCSIYDTRPEACRKFACIWLNGLGVESDRPDILGVMIDVQDLHLGSREAGILHLWEIEAGAMNRPRVREIAEANKNEGLVVYYHHMFGDRGYRLRVELNANYFTDAEIALLVEICREREATS